MRTPHFLLAALVLCGVLVYTAVALNPTPEGQRFSQLFGVALIIVGTLNLLYFHKPRRRRRYTRRTHA